MSPFHSKMHVSISLPWETSGNLASIGIITENTCSYLLEYVFLFGYFVCSEKKNQRKLTRKDTAEVRAAKPPDVGIYLRWRETKNHCALRAWKWISRDMIRKIAVYLLES